MDSGTEGKFLNSPARAYDVWFSVKPTSVSVAARKVRVGFELHLVGSHTDQVTSGQRCEECRRVLETLLDLADQALPIRTGTFSERDSAYEKITRLVVGAECDGQVCLFVHVLQTRGFAQASNGWALESLHEVRRFLLEQGCRQADLLGETKAGPMSFDEPHHPLPRALENNDLAETCVA